MAPKQSKAASQRPAAALDQPPPLSTPQPGVTAADDATEENPRPASGGAASPSRVQGRSPTHTAELSERVLVTLYELTTVAVRHAGSDLFPFLIQELMARHEPLLLDAMAVETRAPNWPTTYHGLDGAAPQVPSVRESRHHMRVALGIISQLLEIDAAPELLVFSAEQRQALAGSVRDLWGASSVADGDPTYERVKIVTALLRHPNGLNREGARTVVRTLREMVELRVLDAQRSQPQLYAYLESPGQSNPDDLEDLVAGVTAASAARPATEGDGAAVASTSAATAPSTTAAVVSASRGRNGHPQLAPTRGDAEGADSASPAPAAYPPPPSAARVSSSSAPAPLVQAMTSSYRSAAQSRSTAPRPPSPSPVAAEPSSSQAASRSTAAASRLLLAGLGGDEAGAQAYTAQRIRSRESTTASNQPSPAEESEPQARPPQPRPGQKALPLSDFTQQPRSQSLSRARRISIPRQDQTGGGASGISTPERQAFPLDISTATPEVPVPVHRAGSVRPVPRPLPPPESRRYVLCHECLCFHPAPGTGETLVCWNL
jgi:hypothetical protein